MNTHSLYHSLLSVHELRTSVTNNLADGDIIHVCHATSSARYLHREEMAHSCGERSQRWVEDAAANMESWSRAPEMSVHQHTFRDRRKEEEIGPANGHISARKYIPRSVKEIQDDDLTACSAETTW